MQTKTSRLIFPYDKTGVGIFPCLNIYSSVISACSGVRFFQNDSLFVGRSYMVEMPLTGCADFHAYACIF